MNQIGVDGTFHNTMSPYLAGRKQVVVVDGVKSNILAVKAGVPQGSRLYREKNYEHNANPHNFQSSSLGSY